MEQKNNLPKEVEKDNSTEMFKEMTKEAQEKIDEAAKQMTGALGQFLQEAEKAARER